MQNLWNFKQKKYFLPFTLWTGGTTAVFTIKFERKLPRGLNAWFRNWDIYQFSSGKINRGDSKHRKLDLLLWNGFHTLSAVLGFCQLNFLKENFRLKLETKLRIQMKIRSISRHNSTKKLFSSFFFIVHFQSINNCRTIAISSTNTKKKFYCLFFWDYMF